MFAAGGRSRYPRSHHTQNRCTNRIQDQIEGDIGGGMVTQVTLNV